MKMTHMYHRHFCLLIAGLLGFSVQITAQQQTGRLSGTVHAVTGEPISGVELELRIFQSDQPTIKQQAVSGSGGGFAFSNLDRNPEQGYGIYTVYQDAEYYSPLFRFKDDAQDISYTMTVYESTTSRDNISVTLHYIQIDSDESGLKITEQLVVENSGDHMYIGSHEIQDGKKETFRAHLPSGFQNLQLGRNFIDFYTFIEDSGVVFTMALPPGEKSFELTYTLPANGTAFNVGRALSARTQSFDVAVLDTTLEVNSATLTSSGIFEEQGQQYVHFSGQQFGPRSFIDIMIQAPQKASEQTAQMPNEKPLPASMMLFALLLIPVIWALMFIIRRNSARPSHQTSIPETETRERLQKRQRLIWALAELDERFEAGTIEKERYQQRRRELKENTIALTRELQQLRP